MSAEPQVVDLDEVDTDTGAEVLLWVQRLRAAAASRPVIVRNCPQMLAHTLYKAGLLGPIVLASVRAEEPHA